MQKLPVTLQLAAMALLIAIASASPGIVSAVKRDAWTTARTIRACGAQHAQFLAGHPDDLPVLGDAGLAAGLGYCAAGRRLEGKPCTTIMPAFVLGNALAPF